MGSRSGDRAHLVLQRAGNVLRKFQDFVSIGGDSSRPDLRFLFDHSRTFVHKPNRWWVLVDSEMKANWRQNGRTGMKSGVQLGRSLSAGFGVWAKPEVWWGPNQDGGGNLKFGLVWVPLRRPPLRRPACFAVPRTVGSNSRAIRSRRRSVPVFPGHQFGRRWIHDVIRRHDLHAVFVKEVLDVAVQRVKRERPRLLPLQADQKCVFDIKIFERRLKDERLGFATHARRPLGGQHQERLHLPPRGVVPNRHRCRREHAVGLAEPRIVSGRLRHDHRIGDGDLLVPKRPDLRRELRAVSPILRHSPMRTEMPMRSAREYVIMKPLMIWFTSPLDPNVIIRPKNTLAPLNASV